MFYVYDFCKTFYINNDALPTSKTLGKDMGLSSANARQLLEDLVETGVLTYNDQKQFMWSRENQKVVKRTSFFNY